MSHLRLLAIIRLSTSAQKHGHGGERQEIEEIKEFAEDLGAEVVDTVAVQERATIFDRPQFQSQLDSAKQLLQEGKIDGVILGSVDRLSRDPFDGGAICRDALTSGLSLFFAAERLDASKEGDQEKIVGALQAARAYVIRLKRQTMPARRARAAAGKLPNGQHRWPFDYDARMGRATPNPERAGWVRKWADILIRGGTLSTIQRVMETACVSAPRGGPRWGRSTITRILSDPALKGEFYHGYERMSSPSFYEPAHRVKAEPQLVYMDKSNAVLTDSLWTAVQERLADNRKLSTRNTKRDYSPLHKLVTCDPCDAACGVDPGHGYPAFRCPSCKKRWSVKKTWDSARENLISLWGSPGLLKETLRRQYTRVESQTTLEQQGRDHMKEVAELKDKETRALRMAIALDGYEAKVGTILYELRMRRHQVEIERDLCEEELRSLRNQEISENDLTEIAAGLSKVVSKWTDNEWRGFLRGVGFRLRVDVPVLENDVMDELWPSGNLLANTTRDVLLRSDRPHAMLTFDRVMAAAAFAFQRS